MDNLNSLGLREVWKVNPTRWGPLVRASFVDPTTGRTWTAQSNLRTLGLAAHARGGPSAYYANELYHMARSIAYRVDGFRKYGHTQ